MDLSWRFDFWFSKLPASPADNGKVRLLVIRPPGGEKGAREAPDEVQVTVQEGVIGDRWFADPERDLGHQVSMMNVHVIESLCEGEPERAILSGDNLLVDLNLSKKNLPAGTKLSIGDAVLEVTDALHRPCKAFHERYGPIAARKVSRANATGNRGRGLMLRVLQGGRVRVGDGIAVERPRRDAENPPQRC